MYIPKESRNRYQLRQTNAFRYDSYSSQRYLKSFFLFCVNLWSKLDNEERCCPVISPYKTTLMSIIRPSKTSLFGIPNRHQSVLITRRRVNFSGLNEHRLHHNFSCESPLCNCKEGIESTVHFLLYCPFHQVHRNKLLGEVSNILNNM